MLSQRQVTPLHNKICLAVIEAARAAAGDRIPMAAVFDSAFHRTIPVYSPTYAIPEGRR